VAIGAHLANREQQIQSPHHVVHLSGYGVFAVDHRVGGGALLGEVDDCVGFDGVDRGGKKIVISNITYVGIDGSAGELVPHA